MAFVIPAIIVVDDGQEKNERSTRHRAKHHPGWRAVQVHAIAPSPGNVEVVDSGADAAIGEKSTGEDEIAQAFSYRYLVGLILQHPSLAGISRNGCTRFRNKCYQGVSQLRREDDFFLAHRLRNLVVERADADDFL